MRLNEFATLQRGDRIVVVVHANGTLNDSHEEVFTVSGEPLEANTLIPAITETGKQYTIYFRDVLRRF